jgi:aryl-alcohol dehydrogenase-like predicted oxidoreductase
MQEEGKMAASQRQIGTGGPLVAPVGYGAMVLEGYYGGIDDAAGVATLRAALDRGVTLIDTADAYGDGHNERLVGEALRGRGRAGVTLATKFGIVFDGTPATELATSWGYSLQICGRPEYVRKSLDRSLQALGVEYIDLWYMHFPDRAVPIEETVGAMAEGVQAGKVRHLGLSNVTAEHVRRAHAVHPVVAVQNEYSLWRREAEVELLPVLRELGIGFVPWSPLGSGFLAGTTSVGADDFRANNPRFSGENRQQNADRFAPLHAIAGELGISSAQLALAWVLAQGEMIVPIPGTRKPERIAENLAAAEVRLPPAVLEQIERIAPRGAAAGQTLL